MDVDEFQQHITESAKHMPLLHFSSPCALGLARMPTEELLGSATLTVGPSGFGPSALTISGHTNATVAVSPLEMCRRTYVTITSHPGAHISRASIQVFLAVFHNPDRVSACTPANATVGACVSSIHALPVRHNTRGDGAVVYRALFVPDPSSAHYVVLVQVRKL